MKGIVVALVALLCSAVPALAAWTPEEWTDTKTLEYLTNCPEEGEYWSPVWLVVLEGELYISLGSKAQSRVDCSTMGPKTSIKIEGELYENLEMVPETDLAEAIEDARWDKYWTNVFVGFAEHRHYRLKPAP